MKIKRGQKLLFPTGNIYRISEFREEGAITRISPIKIVKETLGARDIETLWLKERIQRGKVFILPEQNHPLTKIFR